MNEDDAVRIVRSYIEGLFPKVCSRCGRRFSSLRDFLQQTRHLGDPSFYDIADDQNGPLGPISLANCPCGNTLTIGSEGLPQAQLLELIEWAKADSRKRSIGMRELLRHIRERIDVDVLREDQQSL